MTQSPSEADVRAMVADLDALDALRAQFTGSGWNQDLWTKWNLALLEAWPLLRTELAALREQVARQGEPTVRLDLTDEEIVDRQLAGIPRGADRDPRDHIIPDDGWKWAVPKDAAPQVVRQIPREAKSAVAKWNHGCMVMAQNIDLWLPNCPQCGMPCPEPVAAPIDDQVAKDE